MKHKTYFYLIAAAIVLTGCKIQKKSDVAAKKNLVQKTATTQPQPVTQRELRLGDISYLFVGQSRPNVYNLLISWPATRDSLRLSANNKVLFTEKTSAVQNYSLVNLAGHTEFSLFVEILDQTGRVLSSETLNLAVPEDFVIPDQLVLNQDTKFEYARIFMNQTMITTLNYNLQIKAKELVILNDSLIQGFPENLKAAPALTGRSGGRIQIEAEVATGVLQVILNSESGGDGLQGYYETRIVGKEKNEIRFPKCIDGGSGYNAGNNGHLKIKVERADNFYLDAKNELSLGGSPGPKLGHAPVAYPSIREGDTCPAVPVAGAASAAGTICVAFSGQKEVCQ